ncbi:MAG: hypothetical protein SFY56_07690 [Bacteroidota bacterium]|nr:hypothetical protein [Bacteroidota bacterium]
METEFDTLTFLENNKLDIISKKLENKKKRLELGLTATEVDRRKIDNDISKLECLRKLLSESIIDTDLSPFIEKRYTNALDEIDRGLVIQKIMKIMSSW